MGAGPVCAQPAFDCTRASGEVEELICKDDSLQALDRRLARTWAKATESWPADVVQEQRALQRGWIKGRNDCWKAEDTKQCVEFSYQSRLVELSISAGLVEDPGYRSLICEGDTTPFTATFYNSLEPRAAVLTRGNDQVIALSARSASGARYTAPGVEFWSKGNEAMVTWFGSEFNCALNEAEGE
jgi:uncharacterized protein